MASIRADNLTRAGHGDSRITKRRPQNPRQIAGIGEHHFRTVGHGGRSTLFA